MATSEKTAGEAQWVGDDNTGKQPMRRLTVPLAIDGVIQAGLMLRMLAPRSFPEERPFLDFRANLIAKVNGTIWHLARLEIDPSGPGPHHTNRLNSLAFAPATVTGCHYHPFAENAQIGLHCFDPEENLPVALPEPREIRRYDDVLDAVRSRFVVPGFWTEDPAWLRLLA